jgi:hypothetical protein
MIGNRSAICMSRSRNVSQNGDMEDGIGNFKAFFTPTNPLIRRTFSMQSLDWYLLLSKSAFGFSILIQTGDQAGLYQRLVENE